jgi:hypothetical protein
MSAAGEGNGQDGEAPRSARADSEETSRIVPPSDDTVIWRYMDFTKYVALLESSALYLARADQFVDDQYEGFPTGMPGMARQFELRMQLGRRPSPFEQFFAVAWPQLYTYVSCWHASSGESAAMWKLYAKSEEAVAVKTTFKQLRQLTEKIRPRFGYVGAAQVLYLSDYLLGPTTIGGDDDMMFHGHHARSFFLKRAAYSHEREVRVVVHDRKSGLGPPTPEEAMARDKLGMIFPIDLASFVDGIRVAPRVPSWYLEVVQKITTKYGFNFEVRRSALEQLR